MFRTNLPGFVAACAVAFAAALAITACGRVPAAPDSTAATAATASQLALHSFDEDWLTLQSSALASGPAITGSLQPERRADLRAEVAAVVLQVFKENGESVKRGDLLLRQDDTALRENMSAAEQAGAAASLTHEQAERMLQRLGTLRASGMVSTQALEDAEMRRNSAQSELAAARTKVAQARQQLQRTLVRAPFDGIVSERKVSNGDTAQIGKELIKVIDPNSMRFEGLVSADSIAQVKLGQTVRFRINGYAGQEFLGRVKRIDPAANAVTRQVEVLVEFADVARPSAARPDAARPALAGLYAEGRIDAGSAAMLMLPESALARAGEQAWAWRETDGKSGGKTSSDGSAVNSGKTLTKVALVLGLRDARSGNWEVRSGLAAGERVLRNPGPNLTDGQALAPVPAPAVPAPASAPKEGS